MFRFDWGRRSLDFMFALVLANDSIVLTSLCLQVPMHRPRFLPTTVFEQTDWRLKTAIFVLG